MTYTKEGKDMGRIVKILDEHKRIFEKYLPTYGQGITMATQTVTALYNVLCEYIKSGEMFDRRRLEQEAEADPANWLYIHGDDATQYIMDDVSKCIEQEDYEELLARLAGHICNADDLEALDKVHTRGDVTDCPGRFAWTMQR